MVLREKDQFFLWIVDVSLLKIPSADVVFQPF